MTEPITDRRYSTMTDEGNKPIGDRRYGVSLRGASFPSATNLSRVLSTDDCRLLTEPIGDRRYSLAIWFLTIWVLTVDCLVLILS